MKSLFKSALILITLMNLAQADWEEISKKHFKKRVGTDSPETFIAKEMTKIIGESAEAFNIKVITLSDSVVEAHYPSSLETEISDSDLVRMSYAPHIWIKRDFTGKILEFGSSMLLKKDRSINPRNIEQEVFYFQGKNASKAHIANW